MQMILLRVLFLSVAILLFHCAEKPTVSEVPKTIISGKIIDAETGKPLGRVSISSEPATEQVLTNETGTYILRANVNVGTSYRISATIDGYISNYATAVALEGKARIVDLQLSPSTPQLSTTQDSIFFETNSQSKVIIIENDGDGELNWRITVPAENWLQVTPQSGKAGKQSSTVTITVDRSRIVSNGLYVTQLVITSDGGTRSIYVSMTVEGRNASPQLSLSPISIGYGTTSSRQTIGITNTGNGDLAWQATPSHTWITATPESGVTSGSTQVTINVDRSQLSPGEHTGSIDIVSNGGSITVPITLSVPAPLISLNTRNIDFRSDLETSLLEISNVGSGDLEWVLSTGVSWLSLTPSQGTTAQVTSSITLAVQRQGLAVRNYTGQIHLSSNSTSEPTIDIQVKLSVIEDPVLLTSIDQLDFQADIEALSIDISNANNGSLIWVVSTDDSWITLSPASGEVGTLSQDSVLVTIQRVGLAAGIHQAQVTIASNGGSQIIPVKMEVIQNPILSVVPNQIDFDASLAPFKLSLQNIGTGTLVWRLLEDISWLTVSPTSGAVVSGEEIGVEIIVNSDGLDAGNYVRFLSSQSRSNPAYRFRNRSI